MAQDRMGSDEYPLTQEFVAMMLGASRPTVTVVAGTLQKAGWIGWTRFEPLIASAVLYA
jgi:CRP-like cAMP-binding protein